MLTPRYYARTIGAGAAATIQAYGRYISIVSISASTVFLSIDDDTPQQIISGTRLDCADRRYSRLSFFNTGGVPAVLILLLSEIEVADLRGDALLAAISASLAAIDIDTSAIDTKINTGNGHLVNILASTAAMVIDLAALEVLVTAGNVDLAALEVLLTNAITAVSTGGGTQVLTIATVDDAAGANQACREAFFWTPDADIHFTLGAGPADVNDPLVPANAPITIAINNTVLLQFWNQGGGNETVNIVWRN